VDVVKKKVQKYAGCFWRFVVLCDNINKIISRFVVLCGNINKIISMTACDFFLLSSIYPHVIFLEEEAIASMSPQPVYLTTTGS
jgi:hypothetical protein